MCLWGWECKMRYAMTLDLNLLPNWFYVNLRKLCTYGVLSLFIACYENIKI